MLARRPLGTVEPEASDRPSSPASLFADDVKAGARVRVLLVNGVNLSQLEARDPAHYGTWSLEQVVEDLRHYHGNLDAFQSEHEGALVERLHAARHDGTQAVAINPGAHTHTSYAIRDALELLDIPKAEVHLSHTFGREPFRRYSTINSVVDVTVTGLGPRGYRLAVGMLLRLARQHGR